MSFPIQRPRRLRRTPSIRRMVEETKLHPDNFILPLFTISGKNRKIPVSAMPGIYRMSPDLIAETAQIAHAAGIPSVILFGIPDTKDAAGSSCMGEHGVVQNAVKAVKDIVPEITVITDVCLCE